MPEVQCRTVPAEIKFSCPQCRRSCITYPKTRAVVHALPSCSLWRKAQANKDELAVFLIRGGVELAFPAGDA